MTARTTTATTVATDAWIRNSAGAACRRSRPSMSSPVSGAACACGYFMSRGACWPRASHSVKVASTSVQTAGATSAGRSRGRESYTLGRCFRLLDEKAGRCHRGRVRAGRGFPSSRLCPACGFTCAGKPFDVRSWTCPSCPVRHDRDLNAAKAAEVADVSWQPPVKPVPTEVPRLRHGGDPGRSRPRGRRGL